MIVDRIFAHARHDPHASALDANGTRWTYAAFACAIDACTQQLAHDNLPVGGLAVLRLDRLTDAWLVGLALRRLGLNTVVLDKAMPIGSLGLPAVHCLVVADGDSAAESAQLAREGDCRVIRVSGFEPGRWAHATPPSAPAPAPAGGHILLTSGTTGARKKVLWQPGCEAASLAPLAGLYGIDRSSRVYLADFPLFTAGGHRWAQIVWNQGGQVVTDQRADLGLAYRQAGLTHAFVTPFMLRNLFQLPPQDLRRNDGMRLLVAGGALPRRLADAALERLTPLISTLLASTEASAIALTDLSNVGNLGWHRIVPGREVQVVDALDRPLPAGVLGSLRVRMLDGLTGYLGDPQATQEFFRDGWFHTGDLALFDPLGRLSLRGRATDVINCLGNKLAPEAIEQVIQERLGVEAACVFAAPGPDGEEQLHVALQSRRAITRVELDALAANELRLFGVVRFHVVCLLPRNAMGKLERARLRLMLQKD